MTFRIFRAFKQLPSSSGWRVVGIQMARTIVPSRGPTVVHIFVLFVVVVAGIRKSFPVEAQISSYFRNFRQLSRNISEAKHQLIQIENKLKQLVSSMMAENISKVTNADFITNVLRLQNTAEAKLHPNRVTVTATVKNPTRLIVQATELNLPSEVVKSFVKRNENLESSNEMSLLLPDTPFLNVVGTDFYTNSTKQLNVTFSYQFSFENLKRLMNSISATSQKRIVMLNPKCSFLDFNATRFSNTGCQYIPPDQGTNVTCSCNHTTLFAVLLTVRTSEVPYGVQVWWYVFFTACIKKLCFGTMKQKIMFSEE